MSEPRWLSRRLVDVMHEEMLREHGGSPGVRAGGDDLIESALMRPQQRLAYEPDSDLPALATSYLFGLAMNHGYVDGNERVAFAAAATFLVWNGVQLTASEPDAYDIVIGMIDGQYSEGAIADWFRLNSESRS